MEGAEQDGLMLDVTLIPFAVVLVIVILLVVQSVALRKGAPFVPTDEATVSRMVELSNARSGERAADVGSGDGRIVIGLAKAGAEAHGFEINPFLVLWSRRQVRRAGLSDRATIHWTSFWRQDYAPFDVVTVFGLKRMMKPLEAKLRAELRPGSRVVTNLYPMPTWPHSNREGSVHVYKQT